MAAPPTFVVVVVLIASAGIVLTAADHGFFDGNYHDGGYHDGKDSPDSKSEDPWGEFDERLKENLPLWGGAGREWERSWEEARERLKDAWSRSDRRGEAVWDKMHRNSHEIWEKIFQSSFPPKDEEEQMAERPLPLWDGKWSEKDGDFWDGKWNEKDGDFWDGTWSGKDEDFFSSDGANGKTIKFGPIKNCSKKGDLIIITAPPTISPSQVQVGDTISIKFAATLKKPVDGGKVKVTVTTIGIPVFSRELDICSLLASVQMKCPIQGSFSFEDNPFQFVVPKEVSAIPNRTYSLKAVATDETGHELACLETVLSVQ